MDDLKLHPLYRSFADGQPIGGGDPFGFACRGCGHLCCADKTVLAMPPEAVRIGWHVVRRELGIARWGEMFLGGSTGVPVVALRFDHPSRRCVFSRTVRIRSRAVGALGLLREVRPGPCRVYPLGRASIQEGAGDEARTEYRIVHHCPGFDPDNPEGLPDLKRPAPPGQTVAAWLAGQLNPDMEAEKRFYLEAVLPAFLETHLHAPTQDNPSGRLPDPVALRLLGPMLYPALPLPDVPAGDHAAVMAWLRSLPGLARELARTLTGSNPDAPEDSPPAL